MTEHLNPLRKYLPIALVGVVALLCALAATARAEGWGEVSHVRIPTAEEEPAKGLNFTEGSSVMAFAADPDDRSYYVGDEPNAGEYRIQRFVEGKSEASISFNPPGAKKAHDGEGVVAAGLQIAVDAARNRVYALVLYRRRNTSPKEVKEEEEEFEATGGATGGGEAYPRSPLDSEEAAVGELYAFEYTSGQLVSAKVNTEAKPIPLIGETTAESSTTAFADQSETPKEALLNPRGIAVDPATGDLAIAGVQDQELDLKVEKEGAEKQCRAAVQFILLTEAKGKLTSGKLGHRYVDGADVLRPGDPGCEPAEQVEVPLSPVVTPGGNVLLSSGAETEGQIWELPTPGSESGEGEVQATPRKLYHEAGVGLTLLQAPPEAGAGPTMSFVPEGPEVEIEHHKRQVEGSIYLATKAFDYYPAPLALHYAEAEGKPSQISEIGWMAGSSTEQCGIPRFGEYPILLGGIKETKAAAKGGVLVLAPWVEEALPNTPHVEAFEFGPGGSTTGCPEASLSGLRMHVGENHNADEVSVGEEVILESELKGADAKSVEWELKYKDPETGEEGEEEVTQPSGDFQDPAGEYEFYPLEYEFSHPGNYEITETANTDDLAGEAVKAAEVLKVTVTGGVGNTKPVVTESPVSTKVLEGVSAKFKAAATGATSVQWQVKKGAGAFENDTTDQGVTTDELTVEHTTLAESGYEYRAEFKNTAGETPTTPATLTVEKVTEKAPEVTKQPVSVSVVEGAGATFLAEASGEPAPTVQWEVSTNKGTSFSPISGATSDTLTIGATQKVENGYEYRAVFSNGISPNATTNAATLTVGAPPTITEQPKNLTVSEGGGATFLAEASGEPAPTVQWEVSTNKGTSFSPISGATSDTLTIGATQKVENGYEYRAVFSNGISPNATTNAATLTVDFSPEVTKQPANQSVVEGAAAAFTAEASGEPAPTVQWEVSTNKGTSFSPISGATSMTLKLPGVKEAENGDEYRAVFTNSVAKVDSSPATLTVLETKHEREAREAKEKTEREAKEKAAREAKEKAERETREKAEREAQSKGGGLGGGLPEQVIANPEAKLAGTSISAGSTGMLKLEVTCPSGQSSCIGTVTLRTVGAVSARVHHKKKAVLTLASGSFSVAGGAVETVTLHLSATARKLLARSHGVLRTQVTLVAHDSTGATTRTVETIVTLKLAKPAGRHKKH